jgi:hypothetical protein
MVMADNDFDGFFMAAVVYHIRPVAALLPSHLFLFGDSFLAAPASLMKVGILPS